MRVCSINTSCHGVLWELLMRVYLFKVVYLLPLGRDINSVSLSLISVFIVQHGLVIPGQNNTLKVRCGASLGRGIYLSPNAEFSLG